MNRVPLHKLNGIYIVYRLDYIPTNELSVVKIHLETRVSAISVCVCVWLYVCKDKVQVDGVHTTYNMNLCTRHWYSSAKPEQRKIITFQTNTI